MLAEVQATLRTPQKELYGLSPLKATLVKGLSVYGTKERLGMTAEPVSGIHVRHHQTPLVCSACVVAILAVFTVWLSVCLCVSASSVSPFWPVAFSGV